MGFDVERFLGIVDDDVICPICFGVFNDAVRTSCGHIFCMECILTWFETLRRPEDVLGSADILSCPIDRMFVQPDLESLILVQAQINEMLISCPNKEHGCLDVVQVRHLETHVQDCQYPIDEPVVCPKCQLTYPRHVVHNCLNDLRRVIQQLLEIKDLHEESIADLRDMISTLRSRQQELENTISRQKRLFTSIVGLSVTLIVLTYIYYKK